MYIREMGFSLVVSELVNARKPIIGHNMIYDIAYLYNQFIDTLPETYPEFVREWYTRFPYLYDTKVLSSSLDLFSRTGLDTIYEKCVTDPRIRTLLSVNFDIKNGFVAYENAGIGAHAHEAAYDAYMTGVAFAYMIRWKEPGNGLDKSQKKNKPEA